MSAVVFLLPGTRLVPEVNERASHWSVRQKRAKRQRLAVEVIGRSAIRRASTLRHPPYVVTITRVSSGTLDDDNLAGACKHVRDQVAELLGLDDGDMNQITFRYAQRRGRKGEYSAEVRIEDVP